MSHKAARLVRFSSSNIAAKSISYAKQPRRKPRLKKRPPVHTLQEAIHGFRKLQA